MKYLRYIKAPHLYAKTKKEKESLCNRIVHDVCVGIKSEKEVGIIKMAACEMSLLVPKGAVLIPIPSSKNKIGSNKLLASEIARLVDGRVLVALKRIPGESGYELRKKSLPGPDPKTIMHVRIKQIPKNSVLIDNVATTGVTLKSAAEACEVPVGAVVYAKGDIVKLRKAEDAMRKISGV